MKKEYKEYIWKCDCGHENVLESFFSWRVCEKKEFHPRWMKDNGEWDETYIGDAFYGA